MEKLILLCNDDGIDAKGIKVLEEALEGLGELNVVAPKYEQSASSHSLTLRNSIQVEKISPRHYAVSGTPSDCVLLSVQGFLDRRPDFLVSGINHGPNMGEDVTYSGTVAAAIEGMIIGIPSVAISSLQRSFDSAEVIGAAARSIVSNIITKGIPENRLLNVNIPDPQISTLKGIMFTKLGTRSYRNVLKAEKGPQNEMLYTINGEKPIWKEDEGTDIAAVRMGYVSITPLHLDLTDYKAIVDMERWHIPL